MDLLRRLPFALARRGPAILRVVPDEQWRLAIGFAGDGFRLFRAETSTARAPSPPSPARMCSRR